MLKVIELATMRQTRQLMNRSTLIVLLLLIIASPQYAFIQLKVPRRNNNLLTSSTWRGSIQSLIGKQKYADTYSCLHLSNSINNNDSSSSSSTTTKQAQPLFIDLTPQERILKEALGIEPESPMEKLKRQKERQSKIDKIRNEKKKNTIVAIFAFIAACLNYFWQYTHPVTSLTLLTDMQRKSDDITLIGTNGKPTVVDFWAPVSSSNIIYFL